MKTNHIRLRPDRLDLPLAPCACGRLSSAVLTIEGDVPDDIEALAVAIEYTPAATPSDPNATAANTNATLTDPNPTLTDPTSPARYTAAATRQDDGTWRAYIAPAYFPAATDALKYHVVGTDERGNPRWLGTGNLRIFDNPADGSSITPDILPRNLYAYNPTTGLYYKVVAEINDLGEVSLATDQEGVTL